MRLGDRIAVMRAGKLVQSGRAEDLYKRPVDLFVARLFSEINEVPVRVAGGEVATPFGRLPASGLADGTDAVLCIRQRGVGLGPKGSGTGRELRGVVRSAKFLGDVVRYEVAVEGFDAPLFVRAAPAEGAAAGAEVCLSIDAEQILLFPAIGFETT